MATNNDTIIGGIMTVIGIAGFLIELWLLIIDPLSNEAPFEPARLYWGLAIPVFIGVAGVLIIIAWIGITMIQTPPPEAWDFDDLEDLDDDMDSGSAGSGTSAGGLDGVDGVTVGNKQSLIDAGYDTKEKLAAATVEDLVKLKGIGKASAAKMIDSAKN